MRALFKTAPEPGALEIRDTPSPEPEEGEVIVRVRAASICGSDLHILHWDETARFARPPVILGHEFAGVVTATTRGTRRFREGDLVAAESVVWCGECRPCREGRTNICEQRQLLGLHRPGGLAEAVAVPERLLHRVPSGLPARFAALAEPATVALHAVLLCPPRPGDTVLVTGPGPIGLLAGQIARAFGARVLVAGTRADAATRLPAAQAVGLEPLDPGATVSDALAAMHDGPVDLVLEASGAGAALEAGMHVVRRGGPITAIGLPSRPPAFDLAGALRNELTLRASYAGLSAEVDRVLALLADGRINAGPLVTCYSVDQAIGAFDDAADQRVLKPVVLFDEGA